MPGRAPLMGLHWALPQVAGRFWAAGAQQARRAQPYVAVCCALRKYRHGGQVAHAVGYEMPLLVASEPVQGQVEARLVVWPPPVFVVHPSWDRRLLLQLGPLPASPTLWFGVVWFGAVWCAKRRCYQKAIAGMVLHTGKCKPGGLCVMCCVV